MRITKCRVALLAAALATAGVFAADAGPLGEACKEALGKRTGAVIVFALPEGKILCEVNPAVARKKFHGTSIFKPVAACALLKEKAVTPEETVTTSKSVEVPKYGVTLSSPYEEAGKQVDLYRAIAVSSNSYFYTVGARLSPEVYLAYYKELGLGGCVRAPVTPEEKAAMPAHGGACVSASGRDLLPYLTHLALDPGPEMDAVREGMRRAVAEGTGQGAQVSGGVVCGKTGWLNGAGEFIAFAPREEPAVGIVVVLPGATGSDAAAVAGKVLNAWFSKVKVVASAEPKRRSRR